MYSSKLLILLILSSGNFIESIQVQIDFNESSCLSIFERHIFSS